MYVCVCVCTIYRPSRIFQHSTCHKETDLKIHWPFFKLHCNFIIICWPKFEYIYIFNILGNETLCFICLFKIYIYIYIFVFVNLFRFEYVYVCM